MNEKIKLNGKLRSYLRMPLYLSILLILMNIGVYFLNLHAGLVVTGGIAAYLIVVIFYINRKSPMFLSDMVDFADQFNRLESHMLQELNIPYALMEMDGRLIWTNRLFTELTGKEQYSRRNINSVFPELTPGKFPTEDGREFTETELRYEGHDYRVSMQRVNFEGMESHTGILNSEESSSHLIALYLQDETELKRTVQLVEDNQLVVALAYLDNYEEAMESVEEVRRSLLTALIDRKMTKYFASFDCLVRKMEKDKYFLIMRYNKLEELKKQKFHILDEVKSVNIGNEMAVTLSIGVGLNAGTYLQNFEYSRSAIEMALGRGGDQVVIKNGDTLTYYGGKAQQMEKNTRVKSRVKAQSLKEFMSTKERVVVMGHKITDTDSFGAAIGIYRAGKTLGKPVHIVVNSPSTSIRPLMAGFLSNPEYETNMFVDSRQAKELVDQNTAVIVVDTNKPSYTECPELLNMTKTIIVLDHHRRGNEVIDNAVLSYVEPYASSACEMVAEILQYFADGLRLRSIEADSLYAGILIDTQNFATRAGVRTFEAAAFLRRSGADTTRVRKLLRDNVECYQAKAEAVRKAEIYRNYFAISTCPSEGLESPTVVGAQAANELLNIAGVKASFVLTPYKGEIFVSARAIDEINVQVLMEKMGGGGHLNIAGAQLQGSIEEARKILKGVLDEMFEEGELK